LGKGANVPANAITYTPVSSTRLRVHSQFSLVTNGATGWAARVQYGTGTAPAFNSTGGSPVPFAQNGGGPAALILEPINLFGVVSGLAIGTTYWFDLAINSSNSQIITIGSNSPTQPVGFIFEEF
jgi:hypothetical protein